MRLATLKGEKTLSELVDRLFEIKKQTEPEARAAAEAELLRVNPHLKALNKIPTGAPILVPDLKGMEPGDADPITGRFTALLAQAQTAFLAARETLETSADDAVHEIHAAVRQLKSKEFKTAAGKDAEVTKKMTAVNTELNRRLKEADDLKEFQSTAFNELVSDLIKLGSFAKQAASRAISKQAVADLVEQVTPAKPANTAKPAEPAKPAQPAKPADAAKPATTGTGALKPITTATLRASAAKVKASKPRKSTKAKKASKTKKASKSKKSSKATKASKK